MSGTPRQRCEVSPPATTTTTAPVKAAGQIFPAEPPLPSASVTPMLLQPPPLRRVASTGTLNNSTYGLAPLIEWVPVPGWDDTEMVRGEGGGYFKADAKTGRPYRVNWVRPRDLSRPPTVSSSGAATPVSFSPLPVNGLPSTTYNSYNNNKSSEPEAGPALFNVRDIHLSQEALQQQQQQQLTMAASQVHRHLRFETPDTVASSPLRDGRAKSPATATAAAEMSPLTIRDTVAAFTTSIVEAVAAEEEEGGEAASSSSHADDDEGAEKGRVQGKGSADVDFVGLPRRRTVNSTAAAAPAMAVSPLLLVLQDTKTPSATTARADLTEAETAASGAPSYSYAFQWLSSSNRASGTSNSDERATTTATTAAVVAAAPLSVSPEVMLRRSIPVNCDGYDAHNCSVFTGVRKDGTVSVVMLEPYPERLPYSPRHTFPHQRQPTLLRERQRQERTWPCASPPHSPITPSLPQTQQQRRPSVSADPALRSQTKSPHVSPPTVASPQTTTATATTGAFIQGNSHVTPPLGASAVPRPQLPPQPAQPSATVVPRRHGRGVTSNAKVVREASSLSAAMTAASTVALRGHGNNLAAVLSTAQPVWSPLMNNAPPVVNLAAAGAAGMETATAVLTVSTLANSCSGNAVGSQPPPLQPFAAPAVDATLRPPPEPHAATLKPTSSYTVAPQGRSAATRSEVREFVEAAARARRGGSSGVSASAASMNGREGSASAAAAGGGGASQPVSAAFFKRPKSSTSHRTPATAAVVPPPTAAVHTLNDASNPPRPTNTTASYSILPSWCLRLLDTLLTPMAAAGTGGSSWPNLQSSPRPQPPPQQHEPTPTSGTTTAGSDVDSKMWSVETRNGVPIGWTLKSVTAAERAAAAAAGKSAPVASSTRDEETKPTSLMASTVSSTDDGDVHALSSPLPFSLTTPAAVSVPNPNTCFLHAVSQPGAEVEVKVEVEMDEGQTRENSRGERMRSCGEAATTPRPAQRPSVPSTTLQQQQRRFTRSSIMTHSGLNMQESVNNVSGGHAAAVAATAGGVTEAPLAATSASAGPSYAHMYNGVEMLLNAAAPCTAAPSPTAPLSQSTACAPAPAGRSHSHHRDDVEGVAAVDPRTEEEEEEEEEEAGRTGAVPLAPPPLQATTAANERLRTRSVDVSIALTQFQYYLEQQQRKQRAAATAAATERLLRHGGQPPAPPSLPSSQVASAGEVAPQRSVPASAYILPNSRGNDGQEGAAAAEYTNVACTATRGGADTPSSARRGQTSAERRPGVVAMVVPPPRQTSSSSSSSVPPRPATAGGREAKPLLLPPAGGAPPSAAPGSQIVVDSQTSELPSRAAATSQSPSVGVSGHFPRRPPPQHESQYSRHAVRLSNN